MPDGVRYGGSVKTRATDAKVARESLSGYSVNPFLTMIDRATRWLEQRDKMLANDRDRPGIEFAIAALSKSLHEAVKTLGRARHAGASFHIPDHRVDAAVDVVVKRLKKEVEHDQVSDAAEPR
jgi:hypothetical protein